MKYNLVDSSGWIEYFTEGKNADFFAPLIENPSHLIVPTASVHEVFKFILRKSTESMALRSIECMLQGRVVDLTLELSLDAARLGVLHKLPMADSMMLATARYYQATLWTQDADFKGLAEVHYIEKSNVKPLP